MNPPTLLLVGIDEIAERLGVPRSTVSVWQSRGWPKGNGAKPVKPPKPLGIVSKRVSVYRWSDVARWARATGYLK